MSRKQSIILSALEIVDELGVDGLSLRELAKRQDITEAALYKHFSSKEDILLAVIDYYARYDSNIKNTIQNSKMSPKESIVFFIKSIAEICESHPATTGIVNSFEVLTGDTPSVRKVKEIFQSRSGFINGLVEKGQKEESIDGSFNSEFLADMIIGLLRATTLKWRMSNFSFPLASRVEASLQLLLSRF